MCEWFFVMYRLAPKQSSVNTRRHTHTHTHARTHAHMLSSPSGFHKKFVCTHTHTHTRAHTHTYTHTHTHTHAHTFAILWRVSTFAVRFVVSSAGHAHIDWCCCAQPDRERVVVARVLIYEQKQGTTIWACRVTDMSKWCLMLLHITHVRAHICANYSFAISL